MLETIRTEDLKRFEQWLSCYIADGRTWRCSQTGKESKMYSIRYLFHYLAKYRYIHQNVWDLIPVNVKTPVKEVRYLEKGEPSLLLTCVKKDYEMALLEYERLVSESVDRIPFSAMKKAALIKRDYAIISLLMATGMLSSECASLNLSDVCEETKSIRMGRKNGEQYLEIEEKAWNSLIEYIEEDRTVLNPNDVNTDALFISNKHSRMTVRSFDLILRKYSMEAFGDENAITPADIRNTYIKRALEMTGNAEEVVLIIGMETKQIKEYRRKNQLSGRKKALSPLL